MIHAGLDVGSRTIKWLTFDTEIRDSVTVETGASPLKRCQEIAAASIYERLMVTGYGRHMVASALGGRTVSEITAFAVGSRHLYPNCRTVIDVGGQDCKVILLSDSGAVQKFEMNDRCAAGTGKFLEIMASTLEVDLNGLGTLALSASEAAHISSLCTVFAESEVVSLVARGEETSAIALGLHQAIANRITNMMKRVGIKEKVVFSGGAALNRCLVKLISDGIGIDLTVPPAPHMVGALGAALLDRRMGTGDRI